MTSSGSRRTAVSKIASIAASLGARSRPPSTPESWMAPAWRATANCNARFAPWPSAAMRAFGWRNAGSGSRSRSTTRFASACSDSEKQRGPSQRRRSSLLEEMARLLGWRCGGLVVDAVPERDVALGDPVQDLVGLRLGGHLGLAERLEAGLQVGGERDCELVLVHPPVLGQVGDLLTLAQVVAKLGGR